MYLGFDLGTSNVKAVVVDPHGRIVATGSAPVERFHPAPDAVEQDIEQIWQAAQQAIREAVRNVDAASVRAIGVSSQGGAMQLLGPNDEPQGRVISWLDARGLPFDTKIVDELGRNFFAQRIGYSGTSMTIGQLLRLEQASPDLLRWPNRIGFVGDVIVGRLCGCRAHDATSLGIAMLYNPWLRKADPDVLARVGLREEQLPCLLPATSAAGTLRADVAAILGLRSGIPVSPAVHDQYAASLGAASVDVGAVNFGAGTAWVLLANTSQLMPPVSKEAFVCRHLTDGLYGQMLSMVNGGSAIQWITQLFGGQPVDARSIDAMLGTIASGCDGLRCWPFLSGGPAGHGLGCKGGHFGGITLSHSRNHLVRAVVEGLACELLRHIRMLTGAGFAVNRLTMCGSTSAGRNTPQIIADVTNLPVSCVEAADVSALGAAMLARKLVEPKTDLTDIARQWSPARCTLHPGEASSAYHDLLHDYFAALNDTSTQEDTSTPTTSAPTAD